MGIVKQLLSRFTPAKRAEELSAAEKQLFATLQQFLVELIESLPEDVAITHVLARPQTAEMDGCTRLIASTTSWTLTVKAADGLVCLYKFRACHKSRIEASESRVNLQLALAFDPKQSTWMSDKMPMSEEDIKTIVRATFRDMMRGSIESAYSDSATKSEMLTKLESSICRNVQGLMLERFEMAQKIVNQQETLQSQIARDIHDGPIGRLMILSAALKADQPDAAQISEQLADLATSLRHICSALAPRDLNDWGLPTVLDDYLQNMARRTGIVCDFSPPENLRKLDAEVELHLFRIIQECLNNVERHANAKRVSVAMAETGDRLVIEIVDDGQGISQTEEKKRPGYNTGMSIMRERIELIKCRHDATIRITSPEGKGTQVSIEVNLQ